MSVSDDERPQGDGPVADGGLLDPVPAGGAGDPVRADVLEGTALPALTLPPQVAPRRHELGLHPALLRRDEVGPERLERDRELVVLGQRDGVVDVVRGAGQRAAARGRHGPHRVCPEQRRRAREDEDPRLAPGDVPAVADVLAALQLRGRARTPTRRRTPRRPRPSPGRRGAGRRRPARRASSSTVSASITRNVSNGPACGSRRASSWLSAPAFLSWLSTVANTWAPARSATSAVSSVQLSAITQMRSGGRVCAARESSAAGRRSCSLCAGIRTTTRSGPGGRSRVSSRRSGRTLACVASEQPCRAAGREQVAADDQQHQPEQRQARGDREDAGGTPR